MARDWGGRYLPALMMNVASVAEGAVCERRCRPRRGSPWGPWSKLDPGGVRTVSQTMALASRGPLLSTALTLGKSTSVVKCPRMVHGWRPGGRPEDGDAGSRVRCKPGGGRHQEVSLAATQESGRGPRAVGRPRRGLFLGPAPVRLLQCLGGGAHLLGPAAGAAHSQGPRCPRGGRRAGSRVARAFAYGP